MDELFTDFGEDVKHLVRHIAKMAVVSSQEEQLSTGDTLNSVGLFIHTLDRYFHELLFGCSQLVAFVITDSCDAFQG